MTPAPARPAPESSHSLALLVVLLMLNPATAPAADPPLESGELNVGIWDAVAWSHQASGVCCWITGTDGSFRIEVLEQRSHVETSWATWSWPVALLDQTGTGWTVVLNPDGTGTLNRWGESWREISGDLGLTIRAVLEVWQGRNRTDRRLVVLPPSRPGTFRRDMVRRGRGRGGPGEVLVFRVGVAGALNVQSSRRPGSLTLGTSSSTTISYVSPEIFVPLWPLVDLVEKSR